MTTQIKLRLCCCHLNRNLPSLRRELSTNQLKKHYDILNVNSKSSMKEIKESFLSLSKVYHPDNKLTGSHNKFVELKEAYDALKNGHPATTSDTTKSQYGGNSYYQYDDYTDLKYNGNTYHRSKSTPNHNQQFGGPFYGSKSPWEEYKRAQRAQDTYTYSRFGNHKPSGHVSFTLTMSAIAWIVIFSCASLLWDLRTDKVREKNKEYQERQEKYLAHLKEIEKIEQAIMRKAMAKRSQLAGNYSSSSIMSSMDDSEERDRAISFANLNETPTVAINK